MARVRAVDARASTASAVVAGSNFLTTLGTFRETLEAAREASSPGERAVPLQRRGAKMPPGGSTGVTAARRSR